ncbi:hypothetical protein [Anabaena sp. CCY 9910]|uniref:hypothetical protein n=1 Tax=Anabaena sp. CCY 9910 TaxID=3103870 RepID=UPI0039DFE1A3
MENQLSFVLKLLIISALISVSIKYVAPMWPIPATATNALILVLSPTIILAIALFWRFQTQKQN